MTETKQQYLSKFDLDKEFICTKFVTSAFHLSSQKRHQHGVNQINYLIKLSIVWDECVIGWLTKTIGTVLSLVHCIRNEARLHFADVNRTHPGSSRRSVKRSSSSVRSWSSPDPRRAERDICSGDKFFVNLKYHVPYYIAW